MNNLTANAGYNNKAALNAQKVALNAQLNEQGREFWPSPNAVAANKELVMLLSDGPALLTNLKPFADKYGIPLKKAFFISNPSIEIKYADNDNKVVWCGLIGKYAKYWQSIHSASTEHIKPFASPCSRTYKSDRFDQNLLKREVAIPPKVFEYLKAVAQQENWTTDPEYPDGILWQYLKLTYARLEQQGKLFKGNDCILFNTGLFDNAYNAIYAYIEHSDSSDKRPWVCKRFAGRDDPFMRQNLPGTLQCATWFEKFDDLHFDVTKEVFPAYEHCMIENAVRLPRSLFRHFFIDDKNECEKVLLFLDDLDRMKEEDEEVRRVAEAYALTDKLNSQPSAFNRNVKQRLSLLFFQCIPEFDKLKRHLKDQLDSAIRLAKKIVASDYATAVPTFYPKANSFALMLPLSFEDPLRIDCALVVVRNKNGAYEGKTIFTTGMAYSNARLLRRPDTHWITQYFDKGRVEEPHQD